jgi:peptidyl-prolyl cis-trans isomerase C
MKRSFAALVLMLTVSAAASAAEAQSKPAAKVNGVPIPQYRLDAAVQAGVAQGQPDTPQLRQSVRQALINQEVIAQEAVRQGLNKQPGVAASLELFRVRALAQAYFQDYFKKHPISEEALKKEYERIKPQLATKEYRARHILVNGEDEAKDIITQIKAGGSFEKLAAEKSKDPGSKGRGGDLDWSPASRYVKPFGDALVSLKKGEVTEAPVKTDFGWHVIRLDDDRVARLPSFEEAKPTLERDVQNQTVRKVIADLRAKAKIQ